MSPVSAMGICVEPPATATAPAAALDVHSCKAAPTSKTWVTYDDVHRSIASGLPKLQATGFGAPDMLIAISGGGLIPARILRSMLRSSSSQGGCAAIKVIGLELYDDECEGRPRDAVCRTQWLETGSTSLVGKRILVVDEVDDSRQTLAYVVRELRADIAAEEAALAAAGQPVPPTQLATFVVHCKARAKAGELPADVPQFVGEQVDGDAWIMYAWDAACIDTHNRSAIGEL